MTVFPCCRTPPSLLMSKTITQTKRSCHPIAPCYYSLISSVRQCICGESVRLCLNPPTPADPVIPWKRSIIPLLKKTFNIDSWVDSLWQKWCITIQKLNEVLIHFSVAYATASWSLSAFLFSYRLSCTQAYVVPPQQMTFHQMSLKVRLQIT